LNPAVSGCRGQSFEVELGVAGNHSHADSVAITTRHQRLENLLRRESDLGCDCFGCKVFGVDFVFTQFIANGKLIEQTRRIGLVGHAFSL
jgi:hypothetical protein